MCLVLSEPEFNKFVREEQPTLRQVTSVQHTITFNDKKGSPHQEVQELLDIGEHITQTILRIMPREIQCLSEETARVFQKGFYNWEVQIVEDYPPLGEMLAIMNPEDFSLMGVFRIDKPESTAP